MISVRSLVLSAIGVLLAALPVVSAPNAPVYSADSKTRQSRGGDFRTLLASADSKTPQSSDSNHDNGKTAAASSTDSAGTDSAGKGSTNATAAADNSAGQPTKLQGSVHAIDVEAAESLRQMGDAGKKMQRAMLELMGEATRQHYISVGNPNVIGTLIIPALPTNIMAVGPYLPLRPKWVAYYLDQVGHLIPIYAELVDSLVMPDDVKAQATDMLEKMRPLFADAKQHYLALIDMSKDLKHVHNSHVAEYAVIVHDDIEKMDKIRLEVFKLLKKSEHEDSAEIKKEEKEEKAANEARKEQKEKK